MATIGTFSKTSDGDQDPQPQRPVRPVPAEREGRREGPGLPHLRRPNEFGAAWRKTSRDNREYLSVKLDDPSFVAPIYASLVEAESGYSLIWARSRSVD